jgi:hypothetical protein
MRYYKLNVYPLGAAASDCQQHYFINRMDATMCAQAIRENFFSDALDGTPLYGNMAEFIVCRDLKIPTRCTVYALAITCDSVSAADIKDYVEEAARGVDGLEAAHLDVIEYDTDEDFYAVYDTTPREHILVHFDYLAVP